MQDLPNRGLLNGAFIIDKPVDYTSSDVVSKLKKPLTVNGYAERGFKIGHGGTLDPFATGVLVVLLGEATKFADCYLHSKKAYDGIIKLGVRTDSADLTGTTIETKPIKALSDLEWQAIADSFTQNDYLQTPPMHSAKKKDGVALHTLARRGIEIERAAILKKIFKFDVKKIKEDELQFLVECESGTYVRVIAEDLAARAETVAHLACLRRTRSSDAVIENTLNLDQLIGLIEAKTPLEQIPCFIPLSRVASHISSVLVDAQATQAIRSGIQSTIQTLCRDATVWSAKERYVVIRSKDNGAPIALLEKSPGAHSFRLQRVIL